MRRKLSDRRAVSTVIATVLMILIVTIGLGILLNFVINYTGTYQKGQGSSVLESLTVEDVWFNHPGNNQITVWVYNTGKVSVTVNSIYINGVLVLSSPGPQNILLNRSHVNGTAIPVNGHAQFYIPRSVTESSAYDIKLITNRGSSFEGNYYYA